MKSFFTILLTLLFCSVSFSQTVSVVQDNVENGGSMYYFHGKKVARTSDGTLLVVWTDVGGAGGQINYSVYDSAFDTWSPAAQISAAGDRADKPGIAADDQGNIHACWQERNTSDENYMIMYSKYDGTAWSTPVVVSLQPDNECEEASIEVDSNGNIWVVYNNDGAGEPNEFVYAVTSTDGGTTWSATAVALSSSGLLDGSITNGRCTLVAGPDGKLAATWHNGLPWDSGRREISYNQYDGTTWSGEVMISDTTSVDRVANWYPTVAVDPQANVYVIYHTNDTSADTLRQRYLLMQKKGWDESWEDNTETKTIYIETAGDMLGTSALCDNNGVVHLVYQANVPADTNGLDANYYTFSKDGGDSWSVPLRLGREGFDGGYATLANRIFTDYGIDVAFRESNVAGENDADLTTVILENIPYEYVTDVEDVVEIPTDFDLIRNYPNPFNPSTTIEYTVARSGMVNLSIYDILGNRVATLINNEVQAGSYSVKWNGVDNRNMRVASGIYFAAMETTLGRTVVKLGLLK